ncbi:MAG TPA: hypothetical protein VMW50_10075 [Dehalococcoidia bacterium]|nr:hypothetical protein [Dehalococcoidia bacterium]
MTVYTDTEKMTASYYMEADGFDDYSEYENYAEAFVDQANDILGEDINEALEEEGFEIDYGKARASEFSYDRDHSGTDIYFPISKIEE